MTRRLIVIAIDAEERTCGACHVSDDDAYCSAFRKVLTFNLEKRDWERLPECIAAEQRKETET